MIALSNELLSTLRAREQREGGDGQRGSIPDYTPPSSLQGRGGGVRALLPCALSDLIFTAAL